MFKDRSFDGLRASFADQFDPDGDGFLYRKSMKGAPVRVSLAERDALLAAFNRHLRYAFWGLMCGTLLLIGLLAAFVPDVKNPASQIDMYLGLAVIMALFFCFYRWAWNAPSRELERRPTLGQQRSRAEMRRVMLARTTYGQLGLGLVAIAVLLLRVGEKDDLLVGWNRLWLVGAGLGVIGIAFQACRKWRFDSRES